MKIINNFDDFKKMNIQKSKNEDFEKLNFEKLKQKDEAKTRVMKYIAYKKRTEQEVRNKFKNEIEENMLEEIIEYLKEANYLDDYDFIQKQVREFMILKTLSIKEIKFKLFEKGLDKKLVEKYVDENIEELEEYEKKCIEKIKIKKASTMDEDKINQYLYRKGYPVGKYNY